MSKTHDAGRRDELLAKLDEQPGLDVDSTVRNLHAALSTIVDDLRKPRVSDPHEDEAEREQAIAFAKSLVDRPDGDTAIDHASGAASPGPIDVDQIGPYQLKELIGSGGMGSVYKALHTRLQKIVALKILPAASLKSPEAVARFEREMQAVGRLDHPHIVRAMDAGEADGLHYLAMEYVPGSDLAQLLKKNGRLSVADACECIRQAAVGLHAAHERGMVHRDVKPGNLMLAPQVFGQPVVKILDLGLARVAGSDLHAAGELTTAGQIMGTIDYMAPEQVDNSSAVDPRADVYSLGATLFALLTGGSIFQGRPHQTVMQKLVALGCEDAPSVATLRNDVPPQLAKLISRMLARVPENRIASAADVAESLAPYAAGADLGKLFDSDASAKSATVGPRVSARSFRSRPRRIPVIVAGIAGAALLLGGIFLSLRNEYGEVEVRFGEGVTPEMAASVRVEVSGNGDVQVADASQGWTINVEEGRYDVNLAGGDDRFEINQDSVTVSRDGETFVTLTLKPVDVVATTFLVNPETDYIDADWVAATRALPAAEQVVAVREQLIQQNIAETVSVEHNPDNGSIEVTIAGNQPTFWPLRGFTQCTSLTADIRPDNAGRLQGLAVENLHDVGLSAVNPIAAAWIDSLPELSTINGLAPDEWLLTEDEVQDLRNQLSTMPVDDQCRHLRSLLMRRNPEYDAEPGWQISSTQITQLIFHNQTNQNSLLRDMAPLRALQLVALDIYNTRIVDLTPVAGMNTLEILHIGSTPVRDLSPLAGVPLTALHCKGSRVVDLAPLRGMPLTRFSCADTAVTDLSPLKDMLLVDVDISNQGGGPQRDVSALAGMPIETLYCANLWTLTDLTPLEGMPLKSLDLRNTGVSDLTPLADTSLEVLNCNAEVLEANADVLRSIPTLVSINDLPIAEALATDATHPLLSPESALIDQEWMGTTLALPIEDQVSAVRARLEQENSVEAVTIEHDPASGSVHVTIAGESPTFWPLHGFVTFTSLTADIRPDNAARLVGLPVEHLHDVGLSTLNPIAADWLASLPNIQTINGLSADEWLITEDERQALLEQVSQLAGPEQASFIRSLLMRRNPGFDAMLNWAARQEMSNQISSIAFSEPPELLRDVSPLHLLPLVELHLNYTRVVDLTPFSGMETLRQLHCESTPLRDLSPLTGLSLTALACNRTFVSDLEPLQGMPLTTIGLGWTAVVDLSPLTGMQLAYVDLTSNRLTDLSPLAGMPIELLGIAYNRELADLSPLKGMPLHTLGLVGSPVTDLAPIADAPLTYLSCGDTVSDLSLVAGMPLVTLSCSEEAARLHADVLRSIPTLTTINGQPIAEILAADTTHQLLSPEAALIDQDWVEVTRVLPIADQVEAVRARLAQENSSEAVVIEFDPATASIDVTLTGEHPIFWPLLGFTRFTSLTADMRPDNATRLVNLPVEQLHDVGLSPLNPIAAEWMASLPEISSINGISPDEWLLTADEVTELKAQISQFSAADQANFIRSLLMRRNPGYDAELPWYGTPDQLTHVVFWEQAELLRDVSPLHLLPLVHLQLRGTRVVDLTPFTGMETLRVLDCNFTPLRDLTSLAGLSLTEVCCGHSYVTDLEPLHGMPLTRIELGGTAVVDLSPLEGMSLVDVHFSGGQLSDLSPLAGMPIELLVLDLNFALTDISALQGLPLREFSFGGTPIADLTPIADAPLTYLNCSDTVSDLSPLAGMPLVRLICSEEAARLHIDVLRSIETLQEINGQPAESFLETLAPAPPSSTIDSAEPEAE